MENRINPFIPKLNTEILAYSLWTETKNDNITKSTALWGGNTEIVQYV